MLYRRCKVWIYIFCLMTGVLCMYSSTAENKKLLIALTEQLNRQIRVISIDTSTYQQEIVYEWTPSSVLGYEHADQYIYPSDVRLRRNPMNGTSVFLTCASGGMCAMAEYPSGKCQWEIALKPHDNPHAIELLPNGCIVIAASTGGYIRIYPANNTEDYVQYGFVDAHGLLWDPEMDLLWAVGKSRLSAFEFTGTQESPQLTERTDLRKKLPIANGHDVYAVYGESGRLWVVASAPFQYDKKTGEWIKDYPGWEDLLKTETKSCSSMDGFCIQTIADGTWQSWDTAVLHIYDPVADTYAQCQLSDAAVYRARVWNEEYQ